MSIEIKESIDYPAWTQQDLRAYENRRKRRRGMTSEEERDIGIEGERKRRERKR